MMRVIKWLHPRWGQMLCFWTAAILLASSFSDKVMTTLSTWSNYEYLMDTALAFRIAVVLIVTGLALKVIAVIRPR